MRLEMRGVSGALAAWAAPVETVARLLHKANVWSWRGLRHFLDGAELRLVARNVFAESSPDALSVARADNRALQQLALGSIGENVDEIEGELFNVVVNHHQVAVRALQFLFVGF